MERNKDPFAPFMFIGLMVLLAAVGIYFVVNIMGPSADLYADDPESIARYKEALKNPPAHREDPVRRVSPLWGSGLIPLFSRDQRYRRVIEHEVKTKDLKSAREFIGGTIAAKIDERVLALIELPEARQLFGHVQDAQRKLDALKEIIALVEMNAVPEETNAQLARLTDEFVKIPFDAKACPEHAAELADHYRAHLLPLKDKDEQVKKVAEEIEKKCLPAEPAKK